MVRQPFKRINILVAAYNAAVAVADAAVADDVPQARAGVKEALDAIHAYKSRGHGGYYPGRQRSVLGRAMQDRSIYHPTQCEQLLVIKAGGKLTVPAFHLAGRGHARWNARVDAKNRARLERRLEKSSALRAGMSKIPDGQVGTRVAAPSLPPVMADREMR